MAKLIKCKSCGKEIAADAVSCPNCGSPNKKKVGCFGIFVGVIVFLIAMGYIGKMVSGTDSPSGTTVATNPVPQVTVVVSADQLYTDYEANEVSADQKYKDKTCKIDGVITKIGKDILDTPFVIIGGNGMLNGVQCMFTKKDENQLASLSNGMHVTIVGDVQGKLGEVIVRNCQFQ